MDSRRGLQMWGPVGRWVFLNWPRGSWQYDLICGAIIAGLFILPSPPATPQMGLDEVLAAIETADAAVDSFTADMTSTEHIAMFDDDEVEVGTVEFLKPNYFRRDVTEPGPSTYAIADGKITVYLPRIRQAQIVSLESAEEGGEEAAVVVPGLNSSAELKSAYDVSLDGVGEEDGSRVYRVRLVPHEGTTPAKHYQSILLYVVEGEWHPARRIVMENYSGDTTTVELSNVVRNAGLEPDDFRIDLPPGTEIINQIRRGPTN
jgi:outer membrane lipoprotein-sorting protein